MRDISITLGNCAKKGGRALLSTMGKRISSLEASFAFQMFSTKKANRGSSLFTELLLPCWIWWPCQEKTKKGSCCWCVLFFFSFSSLPMFSLRRIPSYRLNAMIHLPLFSRDFLLYLLLHVHTVFSFCLIQCFDFVIFPIVHLSNRIYLFRVQFPWGLWIMLKYVLPQCCCCWALIAQQIRNWDDAN